MKPVHTLAALALTLTLSVSAQAAQLVGTRQISVASPQRGENLSVTVWYPAEAGGKPVLIGGDKVFKGTLASADAPPAKGSFPLIVFSHGSGGRIEGMNWIATKLAEAGFVVAGPNHPGTTSGYSTPADTPKLWERTQDLSNVITALTSDQQWKNGIDSDRIGVLGFSLGGAAAMEISGARASLDAYVRYCEDYPTMADCIWFAGGRAYVNNAPVRVDKVDLRQVDKVRFDQSNLDRRIKSAVLVDPALALVYDQQSLKDIAIPMAFINLGRPEAVPIAVAAEKLAELTQNGTLNHVVDSNHYSFLPECREGAVEFLKSVGEVDPICQDDVRSRADIHAELQALITDAFTRTLKSPM